MLRILASLWVALAVSCSAWIESALPATLEARSVVLQATTDSQDELLTPKESLATTKSEFLRSLDRLDRMNGHSLERSQLLEQLIASKVEVPVEDILNNDHNAEHQTTDFSIEKPGKWENIQKVAAGE